MSTKQDQIYRTLRHRLLAGQWKPGQRMVEQTLALEMGVNRNPVREALLKLAGEGLLQREPGAGCRVVSMSLEHVTQVYEARTAVEVMAAGLAAKRITPAQLARMESEHELLQRLTHMGQAQEMLESEQRFHGMLVQFSGNAMLMKMWEQCHVVDVGRAVLGSMPHRPGRLEITQRHAIRGHGRLLDALRRGDARRAEVVIRRHLEHSIRHTQWLYRMQAPRTETQT